MKKRLVIIGTIFILILSQLSTFAYAWNGSLSRFTPMGKNGDIHYSDTIKWCKDKGVNSVYSLIIGESCDNVDTLFSGVYRWHLDRRNFTGESEDTRILQSRNEMTLAKRKLDELAAMSKQLNSKLGILERAKISASILKLKTEACVYLGWSIHPLQDLCAHMDAGVNTPDDKIGNTHGMLEASPVNVKFLNPDGSFIIKQMKVETILEGYAYKDYSLYDDPAYDYVNGEWVYIGKDNKEKNTRWIRTREQTYSNLVEFLNYASSMGIDFSGK